MASTQALKPLSLQIISDSICPIPPSFCYIGYKQITRAIAAAQAEHLPLQFNLRFKPFLLDPTLPEDRALNKREHYAARFGGLDGVKAREAQMQERGRRVGINFSYGGFIRQTTESHRLIEKAYLVGGEPAQRAVVEALFAAYFEQEKDIGSATFLAECAVRAGVFADEAEARTWLASGELADGVKKDIREAAAMGVEGVPFIVLDNKFAVSGAQGEETFLEIFRKIAAGSKIAAEDDGETC
ncbi:thioredoxin-like protein [Mycena filopes]|nr:thioredoxin-like protein [Mycena filopes]